MILLVALLVGLAAGLILARLRRLPWTVPKLHHTWLAVLAFLPQVLISYLPARAGAK